MASITNTGKNIQTWPYHGGAMVKLGPGDTDVTSEQLAGLQKHPVFKDFVKKKLLLVNLTEEEQDEAARQRLAKTKEQEASTEADKPKEEGLETLSQRELVKRISEMTDKEQLEQLAHDGRPRVAEAAKQQLASL